MLISIDRNSAEPTYMQLIHCITELVDKGILATGEKLPSVRVLAAELVVNPNTIQKVYTELERRGILEKRPNVHGSFVRERPTVVSGAAERSGTEAERNFAEAVKNACSTGVDKEKLLAMIEEIYGSGV